MANAFHATKGREIDGVVRGPGPTFQDLRANDPNPGPDDVYGSWPQAGGDFTIPNRWYFSEEHAALERERLWPSVWNWACREEHLPKIGSCYVHDFLDDSVLIVRVAEDEFKAFRNTCRHRGTQLRESGSCGVVQKFVCPYHGATWNRDGTIDRWPFPYEFPTVDDRYDLSEVHLARFQGFIFVNTSENPTPFDEYIDPLPRMLFNGSWQDRHPVLHLRKHLRCNWKIVVQAFHETMHVPVTHAQARSVAMVAGSQIDVLSPYVTRVIQPLAVPGDTISKELSEREVLEDILGQQGIDPEPLLATVPEGFRARDWVAQAAAANIHAESGQDVSGSPTVELVDNINYRVFPNFFLLHGYTFTAAHRHIPGPTPDECFFDLMWFQTSRPGEAKPPAPERIDVGLDETLSQYAEGDPYAYVADQDTSNMERQQKGLRASPDGHSIFGNYLESGIVHDLKLMTDMLGVDTLNRDAGDR